jgi:hypothetical protein
MQALATKAARQPLGIVDQLVAPVASPEALVSPLATAASGPSPAGHGRGE